LFSGIGGFDLAAEWMGWENVFHCEWMEFPRKVLDYYWPNADSYTDICKTDFKKYANTIDILTGGFPCQPFSTAGKRKGTDDERYLWGEMLRAVQEIKPTYVIAENVFGITNIDGGLVFEQVCLDLEAEGYEVQPFIIPAVSKNAPHRRDRVWFVAYNHGIIRGERRQFEPTKQSRYRESNEDSNTQINKNATDTDCRGLEGTKKIRRDSINVERESESRIITNTMSIRLQQCKDRAEMGRGQEKVCGKRNQFANGIETISEISNVTDSNGNGFNERNGNNEEQSSQRRKYAQCDAEQSDVNGDIADTEGKSSWGELQQRQTKGKSGGCNSKNEDAADTTGTRGGQDNRQGKPRFNDKKSSSNNWDNFPTQSPVCSGDDGLPTKLDGITFSKWRAESIKGYGNAIVPQVAYEIFKQLQPNANCDNLL
jgi:DNA (cytosine-5)-methyltransferase 1